MKNQGHPLTSIIIRLEISQTTCVKPASKEDVQSPAPHHLGLTPTPKAQPADEHIIFALTVELCGRREAYKATETTKPEEQFNHLVCN